MRRRLAIGFCLLVLCLICFLIISSVEQSAKTSKGVPGFDQSAWLTPPTWASKTGLRIAKLRNNVPTIDRVVLVPDNATFLKAINQWSLKGRWPILIEDAYYTKMFLQRFHPGEVIHLPKVAEPLPVGKALQQQMLKASAKAWDAQPGKSLAQAWQRLDWQPPGVVLTSPNDPAWPAAVALAADRGQPLVFIDTYFGAPNDTLQPQQWQLLQHVIQQAVAATGYTYANLGDDIDTVTIARQLAVKYQLTAGADESLAVTDGLARHPDGRRWAIVGWIYGSSVRSVYQAMCSIFLPQKTALFYNSYPNSGVWRLYGMESAAEELAAIGFDVNLVERPPASVSNWRHLTANGLNFDLILVNSKGDSSNFNLGDGMGFVQDIPSLNVPAIVHFIHSWSATTPDNRDTVAGRWLEYGVYAYVGSVDEPYVQAFIPPIILVKRLQMLTPFLIAAREISTSPWKITTIGDPLLTLMSHKKSRN